MRVVFRNMFLWIRNFSGHFRNTQRKATMLDALCHAVESFWSVNAGKESQKVAAEAIRMVLAYEDAYLANQPGRK